ncbi:hypothetical protein DRH14_03830, partial [Candidatus Shapirobacteria bacterium]
MKQFKIAIDISPTIDANSLRGVGFYTKRLVPALQQQIKKNLDYQNWTIDLVQQNNLDYQKYNLIHYPYFDPFKLSIPPKKIPTIITVHDLIPRQFKSHFPVGIKGEIKWQIQKQRLKQTDYIITDSHSSKYSIHEITKYPLDKIYSIYLAADKKFKPIPQKSNLIKTKKKYNLPTKFVLYVGDINWNKNIPQLVKSCLALNYPLVIVGSSATKTDVPQHPWTKDLIWLQKKYAQLQKQNPKQQKLILTGYVDDQQLN